MLYKSGTPNTVPYGIFRHGESQLRHRSRGTGTERMRLLFLGDHFADFSLDPFQIGFPTTTLDHFVVLLTHDISPDIFNFFRLTT